MNDHDARMQIATEIAAAADLSRDLATSVYSVRIGQTMILKKVIGEVTKLGPEADGWDVLQVLYRELEKVQ